MPFSKPLPEWKNAGTKPPQSKIDSGWAIGDKPPAAWWNWHMYNTYYALQELQLNSVHTEKLGAASGVATLGADSKLTASQLPAIGSAQITDGSITNTDLATDVKVGSLATLTTTNKASVTAAINEVKASDDLKIPLAQKAAANGVATLDATTKIPVAQIPVLPTANHADGSITDAKLATDNKVGSLASLVTTAKGSAVAAINEVDNDLTSHLNDVIRHITGPERATWNAAQLFALTNSSGTSKATTGADLNLTLAAGFYNVLSGDANGQGTAGHMIVLNRGSTANVVQILYTLNQKLYTRQTSDSGATWTAWIEQETTAGAQAKATAAANTAEANAKTASVPRNDTRVNGADLNTYTTTQIAAIGTTVTNGPAGFAYGSIMVTASATDRITQIVFDSGNKKLWIRYGTGSPLVWTSWIDFATSALASGSAAGLMSAADFTKLAGVATNANNYTHPLTHPATMITTDANNRFVSDTEKASYAAKETPAGSQAKADAALAAAQAYAVNMKATGSTADPDATLEGYILTNHANGPGLGLYWHIETRFYSSVSATANRSQTAQAYNSSNARMFIRNYYSGYGWSAWNELAHTDLATSALDGLMRKEDKSKLDGIANNANNYSHPTGDGNLHVPATGTTNNGKFLEAGATPGTFAWANIDWTDIVNKPSTYTPAAHGHTIADVTGLQSALDGKSATSHTHADATTTVSGFLAAADKTKLNGISTGANKTTSSATNGNIAIDGQQVTVYTHPATHAATMIVEDATHRFATDAQIALWTAKASTAVATTTANGLMSSTDKVKLDGISTGANKTTNPAANGVIAIDGVNTTVYAHPTGDGNSHVPATGTTSAGKFLKAAGTANSASWQTMTIADISGLQAQLDAPQQVKLTQDSGAAKVVPGTDLNAVLAPGVYNIPQNSGYTNRPGGSNDLAILLVYGSDPTGNTIQKFINLENDWRGKEYTRVCRGGTWTDWTQTLQTGDAQLFKLTGDNGYTNAISGYDLNGLTWSGFYYGNNLINNPFGSSVYHRVWVMMSEPTSGVQIAMTNNGRMYIRNMTGGTWEPWTVLFSSNNIQTGSLSVVPSAANVPTGVNITFPKAFKKAPIVQVTASTTVPGSTVTGVSVFNVTTTGCTIYVTRTNTSSTGVVWTAIDTE